MSQFYRIGTAMARLGKYAIKMLTDNKFIGKSLIYITNLSDEKYKAFEAFSYSLKLNAKLSPFGTLNFKVEKE